MAITAYSSTCNDIKRNGGIQKVWIADGADIAESDFTISGGEITAITGISGFELMTGDDFAAQWTPSDELQDSNNRLITHTFTLELPNLNKLQRDLIVELRDTCDLIIMFKDFGDSADSSKRNWVIGHEDNLRMKLQTVELDTGRQLEDSKMAMLTFTGKATVPAYTYTGSDPS